MPGPALPAVTEDGDGGPGGGASVVADGLTVESGRPLMGLTVTIEVAVGCWLAAAVKISWW